MESKSTNELIDLALAEEEREEVVPKDYSAIQALHARGTREVLEAGTALCRSLSPSHRRVGAIILGELGTLPRTFPEECCEVLLDLVQKESDESVVSSAIFALGHLGNRRCEAHLVALHHSPNPTIRHAIAFALCGTELPTSIEVLLKFMDDPDYRVRDWATTSIGQTVSADSPEVREALLRRATDPDELTRAEAIHGLARRKDARVIPYLIAGLKEDREHIYLFVDAAKTFLDLSESQERPKEQLIELLKPYYNLHLK